MKKLNQILSKYTMDSNAVLARANCDALFFGAGYIEILSTGHMRYIPYGKIFVNEK